MRILKTELNNKGAQKIRLRSIFLNACAMQHAFGFLGGKGNFPKKYKERLRSRQKKMTNATNISIVDLPQKN